MQLFIALLNDYRVNVGSQNMILHLESVPLENLSSVWYPLEEMDHRKQTE